MRVLSLLLLIVACQVSPAPQAPPDDPRGPVRSATGAAPLDPGERGVLLRGRRERAGRSTPIELTFWSGGAFRLRLGGGDHPSEKGFDGQEAWVTDGRGVARSQQLGSREHLIAEGWARTQQWLSAPAGESPWLAVDGAEDAGQYQLVRPSDTAGVTVTVDAATTRPIEVELRRLGQLKALSLEDWEQRDGRWLPMTITETVNGVVTSVDRFEARERPAGSTGRRPKSEPRDVRYRGAGASRVRAEARFDRGGRAFVLATIDGQREAWMLLDTGFGSHAISRSLADELKLEGSSSVRLHGVSDFAAAGQRRGRSLELGAASLLGPSFMTLLEPTFVELNTDFLSERVGFEVGGVLGAPLFDRAVVVIDDLRGVVEIHDPARFDGSGLRWEPAVFDGTAPCVRGQVRASGEDTPELWFRLDTGSDDTVTISHWVVLAHGLAGDRAGLAPRTLMGPFGEVRGWRKAASVVLLAGSNMGRQTVTLVRDRAPGPLSDPWIGGNVGMRLLRGRKTVLDLGSARVAIVAEGGEEGR